MAYVERVVRRGRVPLGNAEYGAPALAALEGLTVRIEPAMVPRVVDARGELIAKLELKVAGQCAPWFAGA